MSNLIKQVDFENINMTACKTDENKIFVSIKSICEGLGIDTNAQTQRINRDDVLPEGMCKIHVPTSSGEQEVNMLDIEYIPFFLVGIKASMCKEEIRPRLKEFKLKAKDVLAAAFVNKQLSPIDQLRLQYQVIEQHEEKLSNFDSRLAKVENNTTIDYSQQEELRDLGNKKVVAILGGSDAPAYKELNKKVFSSFWRDYKRKLNVNSYKNTLVKDFEIGRKVIIEWQPSKEIAFMIKGCNAQISM